MYNIYNIKPLYYDSWEYKTNGAETKSIPKDVMTITIEVE